MELPIKKKAKERRLEDKTIVILRDGEHVAIRKRPSRGLLAGLYELPNLQGHVSEKEVLDWLKNYGLYPLHIQKITDSKHIFSHVEWDMTAYAVRVAALDETKQKDLLFIETTEIEQNYPIPAAFHAYTKYMNMQLGAEVNMKKQEM